MLNIQEAADDIKKILTVIQGISNKDCFSIKKGIGFYKEKNKSNKLSRLEDNLCRILITTESNHFSIFPGLPQASKSDIIFFLDHLLPKWIKFANGEVFPLLHILFNLKRSPQFLSLETDLYLLIKEASNKKNTQQELEFIETYLKRCIENEMTIETMSDCVI